MGDKGLPQHIVVNGFCFCLTHGFELCHKCPFDFRSMDNYQISEDLKEEDAEELSDDRQPMNVYAYGAVKSNVKDGDEYKYKCTKHDSVDCGTCFDWTKILLDEINEQRAQDKWLKKRANNKWMERAGG